MPGERPADPRGNARGKKGKALSSLVPFLPLSLAAAVVQFLVAIPTPRCIWRCERAVRASPGVWHNLYLKRKKKLVLLRVGMLLPTRRGQGILSTTWGDQKKGKKEKEKRRRGKTKQVPRILCPPLYPRFLWSHLVIPRSMNGKVITTGYVKRPHREDVQSQFKAFWVITPI